MIGIKNGFRRSIPLLALITLLFSACGSLPSKSTEQPVPTITLQPSFTPTPSPRTLDDLSRPGTEHTLSLWEFECRRTKRPGRH